MRGVRSVLGAAGAMLLAALAVTGCTAAGAVSSIKVTSAYVPKPATPGSTVAYLAIRNNGQADRLLAAQTSVGGTVRLRAPDGWHSGVLAMRTVPDIPIPAHSLVRLTPDSYHLMITGAGPMRDGKAIRLRLTFAGAGTITILALVTNPESGGSSYFLN
jgi:copper(I)-binding protein